jgi:bacterioferritin (cytochrome b1)
LQEHNINEETTRQQCELLGNVWETISQVASDLKTQGLTLPVEIDTSLRSTKSLLTLCQENKNMSALAPKEVDAYLGFCIGCCGHDVVTRVKCELRNVEDRLIVQAMNDLGTEPALKLQQKTVKAWEPLRERIITNIETISHALKVERDVVSAYQGVVEENLSYWLGVEEDIADSFRKMMNAAENQKTKTALAEIVTDTKRHIETLESMRQSLKKILAEDKQHAKMLAELSNE